MNQGRNLFKYLLRFIQIFMCIPLLVHADEADKHLDAATTALPARSQFKVIAATTQHVNMLKNGGYVLYMRHGPSDARFPDQLPLQLDRCESQRPLSEKGRELLQQIGQHISRLNLPYEAVISSPFCRVQQSADLVFGGPVTVDPELRYTAAMPDAQKQPAVARTRYWISLPVQDPTKNRVVIAHGPNIAEIMDYLPPEGGIIIFRPLGTDGFEYVASIEPRQWQPLLKELGLP